MSKIPTKSMELMLAGWRKSHNSGMVISFLVPPEDEAYFENATARKGKIAGQRYATVFVQLRDDETPDPESIKPKPTVLVQETPPKVAHKARFPGGLCGLAVRWCKDMHFQAWIDAAVPNEFETMSEEHAIELVKKVCLIDSRKELDDPVSSAGDVFREKILEPYAAQRKEDGVDG